MTTNPTSSIIQPSFAGGELSPSLQGRVDLARYAISLSTCRNFIVLPYGGVSNRPGFQFVAAAKFADRRTRLIEFVFNEDQTYIVELGHQYIRFHRDGAPLLDGGSPVEVATPWTESEIFNIKYVQSADVLTLLHPDHAPRELRRFSDTNWQLAEFDNQLGPFQSQNVDEAITVTADGQTGSVTLTASQSIFSSEHVDTLMKITAVDAGDNSAWQNRAEVAVGDKRYVSDRVYEAIELAPDPGSAGVLTGDNTPTHTEGAQWDGPREPVQGITEILGVKWQYLHSGVGIVRITGVSSGTSATADVIEMIPEQVVNSGSYRWAQAAWDDERGYPGTASYYQQRLVLAGSRAEPQTFWMSEAGIFNGFATTVPIEADDGITFTLAARQVNEIRHLVPLDSLLALTSGAEWSIEGNDQGLSADTISASAESYRGASHLPPLLVGSSALYVQSRGAIVRDLAYSFELDGFTGDDLTVFSNHLFQGHTLVDWTYAQEPNSVVWAVRDDGILLSMTYVREQQVIAWARHDTKGDFESVATVAEGDEDHTYAVIKRQINGSTVRYIERLPSREISKARDFFGVDSGLTYDGRDTSGETVTLTGGTEWTTDESLTLNASGPAFDSSMVGRRIRVTRDIYVDTKLETSEFADVDVTAFQDDTTLTVEPVRLVPEELRGQTSTEWALMASTLSGLEHLEGENVSILADGDVSPDRTVSGGSITLQTPAAVAHAGLAFDSDFETLPISSISEGGTTIRDKTKSVPGVGMQLDKSRGVFVARDRRSWDGRGDLIELKQREFEDWAESTQMLTGYARVAIPTGWDHDGRIFIRQSDPLPLTILAVIPEVQIGGKP